MAFTFSVTGTGTNKVLTVSSPDKVTISTDGTSVSLFQAGSAPQTVGLLADFKADGLPIQTYWNGVPAANVVVDLAALMNSTFMGKYSNGSILEANASTSNGVKLTEGEATNLFANIGKLTNGSLADLYIVNNSLPTTGPTQTALDLKLSNVVGDIAKVEATTGGTIDAREYDYASFILAGSSGVDTIYGGAGNDSISGGSSGADFLFGGDGNDTIIGGTLNDEISGGAGADTFQIDLNTDTISDLGNGADILVVSNTATKLTAIVTTDWTASAATSNNLSNTAVTLDLGHGIDVDLRAATGSAGYTITAALNTAGSIVTGSTIHDIITGSTLNDELRGAAGNDTITGDAGADAIFGGAGANSLIGGGGADTFTVIGSDKIDDLGNGADVLVVASTGIVTSAVVTTDWTATSATKNEGVAQINLNNGIDVDLRAAGGNQGYTIIAGSGNGTASNIVGSNFADSIVGSTANDEIRGAQGNDSIYGGSGSDIIYGGNGADVFQVTDGTDTIADLGFGTDVLIVGSGAGANAIVVSDWVATSGTSNSGTVRVTLDLKDGVDVNLSAALGDNNLGYTISADGNVQASVIAGATTADYITGSSLNDELRGYKGNDTIFGGSGDDAIYGGAGDNSINGGAGSDTFNLNGGTDAVTDLGNGADALVVTGAATVVNAAVTTDWTATAATSNTSLGRVTLDLASGVDVNLRAATGDHGYTIDVSGTSAAAVIVGSNFADSILGGDKSDELRGAQGADTLTGGAGNDILFGGNGADTFDVTSGGDTIRDLGLGADILKASGGGNTTVVANVVSDWTASAETSNTAASVQLYLDDGVDIDLRLTAAGSFNVSAVNNTSSSNITGSNQGDDLNGSAAADVIRGAKGNDVINGYAGDDTISGGEGWDTLIGGDGADTFLYFSGSTGVTETTGDRIEFFNSSEDRISTGIAGLTAADVTIADGTAQDGFNAFKAAAEAAFAAGKEVYVAYNQDAFGNALVAINNNGGVTFTSGDSLITLVGVNQATEISASNFIA